jgi:4-amino-4-deoxy-L-arabinose transferase-like glycosyltransferase
MIISKKRIWFLLVVVAILWFFGLSARHLADPDEGRYAEIPLRMLLTGDWITPRLNGLKYFEKPPLQYWMTAVAYILFGTSEVASRLWTSLTGFLAVIATCYAGARLFSLRVGIHAGLILISSNLFFLSGMINTLDMGVSCFLTIALAGFLCAQRDEATPRQTTYGMWLAWGSIALAILSKGLIGLVLPGGVLLCYSLIHRDWRLWTRLQLTSGIALVIVIAAPWFILTARANPEFLHFFFIHEHVDRFTSAVHGRFHPWYYYVPVVVIGLCPWLLLLPIALRKAWTTRGLPQRFRPERFLVIWIAVIYLFFSISNSKLPFYLVPILPPIALLMAHTIPRLNHAQLVRRFMPILALGMLAAGSAYFYQFFSAQKMAIAQGHVLGWLLAGATVLAFGWGLGCWLITRKKIDAWILITALSSLLGSQLVMRDIDRIAPDLGSYRTAQQIASLYPSGPIYSVGVFRQSLSFYLKRPVTVVAYQGELAFGLEQEPARGIATLDTFKKVWRTTPGALAVMQEKTFDLLRASLPIDVIGVDGDLMLVTLSLTGEKLGTSGGASRSARRCAASTVPCCAFCAR